MSLDRYCRTSPLIRMFWNGWESTNIILQRQGWIFRVDEEYSLDRYRIFFRSPDKKFHGVTSYLDRNCLLDSKMNISQNIVVRCDVQLASDVFIIAQDIPTLSFSDMSDEIQPLNRYSLQQIFGSPMEMSEGGILLPEESIPDLLGKILEMQEPSRQDRLKQRIREERNRIISVPAKIIQFS